MSQQYRLHRVDLAVPTAVQSGRQVAARLSADSPLAWRHGHGGPGEDAHPRITVDKFVAQFMLHLGPVLIRVQ
jgi:hypothetical protein